MSRLSLRLKVTLGFTAAMAVVLAATGLFLYLRFESELNQSLERDLRARVDDVRTLLAQSDTGLREAGGAALASTGDRLAQVLDARGGVIDFTPPLGSRPMLARAELARAQHGTVSVTERNVAGIQGAVRILATPVRAQDRNLIVAAGASLASHDRALGNLASLLLIGGPAALAFAAAIGFAVTTGALRRVETMRRRAQEISLARPGSRLPVPAANDDIGRLARTLNEMLARGEAAFAQERSFVADASHELRTPLSILRAELEVALHRPGGREELLSAVAAAAQETDRLSRLADDLLTLASADGGRLPVARSRVNVDELLERVRARFVDRVRRQRRALVIAGSSHLVIEADPVRLEQGIGKLVDNAVRYGAGSTVLSAVLNENRVELHVSDEGEGFPGPFVAHAFERFSRADAARTSEGTGLGLAIVEAVAQAHGGSAHVGNLAGGGADAWLSLPVVSGVRQDPRGQASGRGQDPGVERVQAVAQVGDLKVGLERERALAGIDALADPIGTRERVRVTRPGGARLGIHDGGLLAGRDLSADVAREVKREREVE